MNPDEIKAERNNRRDEELERIKKELDYILSLDRTELLPAHIDFLKARRDYLTDKQQDDYSDVLNAKTPEVKKAPKNEDEDEDKEDEQTEKTDAVDYSPSAHVAKAEEKNPNDGVTNRPAEKKEQVSYNDLKARAETAGLKVRPGTSTKDLANLVAKAENSPRIENDHGQIPQK